MQFYWKTLAAFALAASSTIVQVTPFGDDQKAAGLQLLSIDLYHGDRIVIGVGLNFEKEVGVFHGHKTGTFQSNKVDRGEYITGFSAYLDSNSIKYIHLSTNTGKNSLVFGNSQAMYPNPQAAPSGQQLVGFTGDQNNDYVTDLGPVWGQGP